MTKTRDDDKYMVLTPDLWPCWPVLPVKRYVDEVLEVGIIVDRIDERDVSRTLYRIALPQLTSGPLAPQLENVPSIVYVDVDALLDDGWVVD